MQEQIGTFVSGETPGETQRQGIGIEKVFNCFHGFRWRGANSQFPRIPLSREVDEQLPARRPHLPELLVRDTADASFQRVHLSEPTAFSAGLRPKFGGCRRDPAGYVNAISDMPDGNFILWPARK